MLELIATIFIVLLIIVLAVLGFTVFVSYLTQASYVSPLDDYALHCRKCKGTVCLGCECDDVRCCHDVRL